MTKLPQNSFIRIIKAFGYSWQGLKAAFLSEPAFRQELLLMLFALPLALYLNIPALSKAVLIASLFFILLAELINTAIEAIVDRISLDIHPLSKKAKDVGSALVLVAFIQAGIVWGIVICHQIWG